MRVMIAFGRQSESSGQVINILPGSLWPATRDVPVRVICNRPPSPFSRTPYAASWLHNILSRVQ